MVSEKRLDFMRLSREIEERRNATTLVIFATPFCFGNWEVCGTWLVLLESVLERGCFCLCQASRCQPYYLSPRGQFWGARSVTTPVAGRQQLDGGACASSQQPAHPAGPHPGSQQNLEHPRLCVYQPLEPGGSVSITPLNTVFWGGQAQISHDTLLWKHLTFEGAVEEILGLGELLFLFYEIKHADFLKTQGRLIKKPTSAHCWIVLNHVAFCNHKEKWGRLANAWTAFT